MSRPFGVISVYDSDPAPLLGLFGDFVIFDQATERLRATGVLADLPNLRKAEHVGHDLKNSTDWIVENYDSLPPLVAFVKSNIVPRHVESEETLKRLLKRQTLTPLWNTPSMPQILPSIASVAQEGLLLEINNSHYLKGHARFSSFDAFSRFVFTQSPAPQQIWIPFAPGGCYLVPRENIRNAPRGLYEFLSYISSYQFFPPEAFLVERILWTIFTTSSEFDTRFAEGGGWLSEIPNLGTYIGAPAGLRGNLRRMFFGGPPDNVPLR